MDMENLNPINFWDGDICLGLFKKPFRNGSGYNFKKSKDKITAEQPLAVEYAENLRVIKEAFELCGDIVIREFGINVEPPIKAFVVYIGPLVDNQMVSEYILKTAMMADTRLPSSIRITKVNSAQEILEHLLDAAKTLSTTDLGKLIDHVLDGSTALIMDGSGTAILADLRSGEKRAIDEPDTEPVVRGPREGFVESIDTNLCLMRRRIKSARFKVELDQVGSITKTKLAICYIQDLANKQLVGEVKRRLDRINRAEISGSNYIEELISDERISLFPLLQYTERPDKTAAALLEGRVAVIVDNTPMTLIVPATFVSHIQAADDYYNNSVFATFIRLLRFIAFNIALLLPAATITAFSFHQELVPTPLLTTAAGARQNLPFPIVLEIILMEVTFELLQEAGVRLPKTFGQAISTVGGLVIGQAAIQAGFVSPISVIVVAITAIASFALPSYAMSTAIRILRFGFIALAGLLGGVGVMFGLMVLLAYLCSLRSFGIPYLSPFAPLSTEDLKDTVVRVPWWAMLTRPRLFTSNRIRQGREQGPHKPNRGGQGS